MASKLGGAAVPWRGSQDRRASRTYAALENGLYANGNSQSNPRRSNPPGRAARSRSALRLWGTRLGLVPHDASRSAGGLPLAMCSNDVEPRTPWLRSAPHVQGDRRTTGRCRAIMCDRMPQGFRWVNANVNLAVTAKPVEGSPIEGRAYKKTTGGYFASISRVRTSATECSASTDAHDDLVQSYCGCALSLDTQEEGRSISRRSQTHHGRGRRNGADHSNAAFLPNGSPSPVATTSGRSLPSRRASAARWDAKVIGPQDLQAGGQGDPGPAYATKIGTRRESPHLDDIQVWALWSLSEADGEAGHQAASPFVRSAQSLAAASNFRSVSTPWLLKPRFAASRTVMYGTLARRASSAVFSSPWAARISLRVSSMPCMHHVYGIA